MIICMDLTTAFSKLIFYVFYTCIFIYILFTEGLFDGQSHAYSIKYSCPNIGSIIPWRFVKIEAKSNQVRPSWFRLSIRSSCKAHVWTNKKTLKKSASDFPQFCQQLVYLKKLTFGMSNCLCNGKTSEPSVQTNIFHAWIPFKKQQGTSSSPTLRFHGKMYCQQGYHEKVPAVR